MSSCYRLMMHSSTEGDGWALVLINHVHPIISLFLLLSPHSHSISLSQLIWLTPPSLSTVAPKLPTQFFPCSFFPSPPISSLLCSSVRGNFHSQSSRPGRRFHCGNGAEQQDPANAKQSHAEEDQGHTHTHAHTPMKAHMKLHACTHARRQRQARTHTPTETYTHTHKTPPITYIQLQFVQARFTF